eukprot:TRINITY_DN1955_c0_g1_i1.p1 TRINITY_DN1955_c0_g1~~TRINITY_DN1955_c0_g1_i1.p1  ORF type:complete len:575 (-),score=113.51 TRINITY_DN1955_c0_g1_i1:527-2251(-)
MMRLSMMSAANALLLYLWLVCGSFCHVAQGYDLNATIDGFPRYPDFVEPPGLYADEHGVLAVTLELTVGRINVGPYLFNARMYNGTMPGPTLYLKPGDHLSLTLMNHLGPQNYSGFETNSLHDLNTTNIHTHGLHVPSTSDNVFTSIQPSHTFTYEYDICEDHYPGSHFYHPHHHGSASIQMYTMHGAIVVLPPHDEFLDDFFRNIDFKVAFLEHMYAEASALGAESVYDLEDIGYSEVHYDLVDNSELYNISSSKYNVFINGQYQPVITVNRNEWFGFRFIHVGAQYAFMVSFQGCETKLVSRDGVYLSEAIIEDVIILFPGMRADVAVRCPDNGIFPVSNVNSASTEWFCEIENWVHCFDEDDVLLFIINSVGEGVENQDWPASWQPPPKPFYLQDLSSIPQAMINGTFEIVGGFDAEDSSSPAFNEHAFVNETDYIKGFSMHPYGIYELNLTMDEGYTANHPVHLHVNHFQIVGEIVRNQDDDYTSSGSGNITSLYRIGEHRDTVIVFPNRVLVVRMGTFGFTGTITVHCHYLTHADLGMMATIAVSASEWDQGLQNDLEDFESMDEEQPI